MRPLRRMVREAAAVWRLQGGVLLRPRVPEGGVEAAQEDVPSFTGSEVQVSDSPAEPSDATTPQKKNYVELNTRRL